MNQKMREYYSRLSERYYLWNARKALAASGTIWNGLWPMERPKGYWNSAKRYTAFTGLRSASAK